MKLNKRNYFSQSANLEFLSVSQFKAFSKCPAAAMAELNGEYQREMTTALLVGSYIDSHFEGTLKNFEQQHPEIFKRDGTLKAEFLQAQEIIHRIESDRLSMEFMSGKKQVIMTGIIAGVPVKIKIDSLHPDKIVDQKIMRNFENIYVEDRGSLPWFMAWEYDLQGAVYQEIVRQNIGKQLPFYLQAATKEKTTDLDIVHIQQQDLDYALDRFIQDAPTFDAMKCGIVSIERCERCDFCKSTKVLTAPTESSDFYLM